MYAYGTNCQCNNCGKKWAITYKDVMEFNQVMRTTRGQISLAAFTFGSALLSGNKNLILNSNIQNNGVINNANHVIDRYKNGDMLQDKYCPECRSPIIQTERFYYEIDNQANYVRSITKEDYDKEVQRISVHNQQMAKNQKLKNYHTWTIIMLVLCPSIGFILLWFDKMIDEKKRHLACKIFAWFMVIGIIFMILASIIVNISTSFI